MKKYRCKVCGEIITEGMEVCPVCKVGPDKWEEIVEGNERVWATEHKIGEGLACGDEEIIAGLRANFEGECKVCGEIITEGMEVCPVCKVGPDKWEEIVEGNERVWATEHKIGEGLACGDEEIIAGLRANFEGECTEVGMYLAMSRVAD